MHCKILAYVNGGESDPIKRAKTVNEDPRQRERRFMSLNVDIEFYALPSMNCFKCIACIAKA